MRRNFRTRDEITYTSVRATRTFETDWRLYLQFRTTSRPTRSNVRIRETSKQNIKTKLSKPYHHMYVEWNLCTRYIHSTQSRFSIFFSKFPYNYRRAAFFHNPATNSEPSISKTGKTTLLSKLPILPTQAGCQSFRRVFKLSKKVDCNFRNFRKVSETGSITSNDVHVSIEDQGRRCSR